MILSTCGQLLLLLVVLLVLVVVVLLCVSLSVWPNITNSKGSTVSRAHKNVCACVPVCACVCARARVRVCQDIMVTNIPTQSVKLPGVAPEPCLCLNTCAIAAAPSTWPFSVTHVSTNATPAPVLQPAL